MKLYKYMSEAAGLAFLKEPALRLTPANCLNDPFECQITTTTKQSINRFLRDYGATRETKSIYNENLQNFIGSHGIVSLTTEPDNILMWSHYADEHKGVVIEFEVDDRAPYELFMTMNEPAQSSDATFDKVSYSKERCFPIEVSPNNLGAVRKHYYLRKAKGWKYENEYRYVLPFDMTQFMLVKELHAPRAFNSLHIARQEVTEGGLIRSQRIDAALDFTGHHEAWMDSKETGAMFFILIDETKIGRIILGAHCNIDAFKNTLEEYATELPYRNYQNIFDDSFIDVYQAELDTNQYKLKLNNINEIHTPQ